MVDSLSSVSASSTPDLAALRQQMLEKMYSDMDADSDSAVSEEEMVAAMGKHAPEGSDTSTMVSEIFDEYDSDGDGALSQDEFATYGASMKAPSSGPPAGGGPRGAGGDDGSLSLLEDAEEESDEAYYDAADANEDGEVTIEERLQYNREQAEQYQRIAAAAGDPAQEKATDAIA